MANSIFEASLEAFPVSVSSVNFLGQATFPTKSIQVSNTTVGGLSGITYDPQTGSYYAISDDRGTPPNEPGQAPRFYTLRIDLSSGRLDNSKVAFTGVTSLRRPDGNTYAPLSTDTEAIELSPNRTLYIATEGEVTATGNQRVNPGILEFGLNGQFIRSLTTPSKFLPDAPTAAAARRGTRDNLAFESATLTPDGNTLYTMNEGTLVQDGAAAAVGVGARNRLVAFDPITGQERAEYLYVTDPLAVTPIPATSFGVQGVTDVLSIDNRGTLLILERSFSNGVAGTGNTIKLFEAKINNATDISGIDSLTNVDINSIRPIEKRLVLNFDDLRLATGLDNLEGVTFGPILPNGQQSLIIVSDDNFSPGTVAFTQVLAFGINLS